MLIYPVEADVLVFLKSIIEALQPFAKAHSVSLTFECDKKTLCVSYHPESVAADLIQLLCRIITFTPQQHSVALKVSVHDEPDKFHLKLIVKNTGVNIARIGEIACNTQNSVIIHSYKDKSTACEINWFLEFLEKPLDTLAQSQGMSETVSHLTDDVRGFYMASHNTKTASVKNEESRMAILASEKPNEAFFLQKVMAVINARIGYETFDIEQLARSMAIGRMQLHRRLKPLVNQSPAHFIRDSRLAKAKTMIEKEDLSIGEICYRVGFASQSHFTRVFIKKYCVRPMEFRKGK